jgi:DNA repair protein RadC
MLSQRAEKLLTIRGVSDAVAFFTDLFTQCDLDLETLWIIHLDRQGHYLYVSRHDGDECGTAFPLKTIILDAAAHDTTNIVLAHNHPSGDPTPSHSDCTVTRRLAIAAEAVGVKIADHIVFAREGHRSFRELGLL